MSKAPSVRFEGFTEYWAQQNLGDITNILSASRVHKDEWKESGIPFFRSSDVVSAYKGDNNEKAYISEELYEELIKSSGRLKKDDILITGGGSIGIPYIVPNNEPLYSKDADLIWIKQSDFHDSKYLYTYFFSTGFRKYIRSISHTGTIAHYTIEQVKETPVSLPSIIEQKAIGCFFDRIDKLITLYQLKYEKLVNTKKSLLYKMFPQNGSKTPEIRFKGFTGDWEQRKLSDCCGQFSTTLNPQDTPDVIFAEYSMPAFDNGEVPDIVTGSTMNSARKILDKPCLLINKLNVRKRRIWNVERPKKNSVSSAEFVPVYSDEINLGFLKHIVLSDSFTAFLEDCSSGSSNSQKRVTPDVIMSATFLLPSKSEQDRIGDFLAMVDNIIDLHYRKLGKLKQIKQAMLHKMFL